MVHKGVRLQRPALPVNHRLADKQVGSVANSGQPTQTKKSISSGTIELISDTTGKTSPMLTTPSFLTGGVKDSGGSSASTTDTAKNLVSQRSEIATEELPRYRNTACELEQVCLILG